jgi:hypothetical protein
LTKLPPAYVPINSASSHHLKPPFLALTDLQARALDSPMARQEVRRAAAESDLAFTPIYYCFRGVLMT